MDSLEFLYEVWGKQGQGFAFLSLRRDSSSWMDIAFKLGVDEIEVPDPSEGDVYFCPNLFSRPRRRKELVLPSCWLYADLDTVVPIHEDGAVLSPSVAWESSPGRYQALWHMDEMIEPQRHSELNRKLTYMLGADKGGWDLTQVLRVPGTINHKYTDKPEVKLLWQSV